MTGPDDASPEAVAAARDGILHPGTGPATVNGLRLRKIMGRYGWRAAQPGTGVDGWMMRRYDQTGTVLVSTSTYSGTPFLWTHASIAYNDHTPTYDDLGAVAPRRCGVAPAGPTRCSRPPPTTSTSTSTPCTCSAAPTVSACCPTSPSSDR
jgi:hypothetical protein